MTLKILVVDDQLQHNEIGFKAFLDIEEFDVTYATSKENFLSLDIRVFDVVLLDINTDKWNLLFSHSLEKIGDSAPIILTSSRMHQSSTLARIQESLAEEKDVRISSVLDINPFLNNELTEQAYENLKKCYQTIINISANKKRNVEIRGNDTIQIMHISDPQYGDPDTDDWVLFLEKEMGRFVREDLGKIDFLVITGDIAYSGSTEEYELALERIRKLIVEITELPLDFAQERILLVPGNHDVDFRFANIQNQKIAFGSDKVEIKPTEALDKDVNSRLGMIPFRSFAFQLTNDENWLNKDELHWVNNSFIFYGIRFILFNSAEFINAESPTKPRVFSRSLEELAIDAHVDEREYFNIFISHHGPVDPDYPDQVQSINDDWNQLAPFLKEANIRMWLHGHGHARLTMPFPFKPITNDELLEMKNDLRPSKKGKNPLGRDKFVRIMAPTTHLSGKARDPEERMGFNLIKLNRKDCEVKSIEVQHFAYDKMEMDDLRELHVIFKT